MANKLLTDITRLGGPRNYLSDILYYASDRSVEQYKKMRMHPICWLGLSFIKLGLPKVPFNIECDEDEDIRLITEKVLKKIWDRLIREASECLDFGFKACENRYMAGSIKYYDEDENIKDFEGTLLKTPKGIDSETVEILIEKDGSFIGFRQDYDDNRKCLAVDRKALVFTHNLESGNYYGISALEPIFPYWYDSNINRQFHMRWLERKGTGLFKGTYPMGENKIDGTVVDNQDIMLNLLDGIMEGTHVALPSGADEKGNLQWDINLIEGADKTDPFIARANYLDETILKGLIIPEKALTQGEIGARASVEAFQSLFIQRKQDILDQIVDIIDRYLLPNFIELNFGKDVEIHVKAGKLDDSSKETANSIVQKLVEKGSEKVEQQWLIDKTGIPLEEREEIPEPLAFPEEDPEEENDKNPEEENAKKTDDEELKKVEKKEKFADVRWRALTKRENQFNMSQLGSFLDEASNQFQSNITKEIERQLDRVSGYLDKNYDVSGKYLDVVDGIGIQTAPIKRIFKDYLNTVYGYVFTSLQTGVEGGNKFAVDTANSFIGFRIGLTGGKFANDLESAIKYQVASDLSSQISKPSLLENLKNIVLGFINTKIGNISETELGFVLGKANIDYFLLNEKLVKNGTLSPEKAIKRFQYSAILDGKECALCRKLDGTVVEAGSSVMSQYSTPLHFQCRCTWLPITQEEIDDDRYEDTTLTTIKDKPVTSQQLTAGLGDSVNLQTFSERCNHA